jgi:uncharacterized membrane protein YcaP (DUF421 family)
MNPFDIFNHVFGAYVENLSLSHMIYRSLFIYIIGIIFTRFNKKFMSFRTVEDFFLFILIGSVLANAIVGPLFYETLAMAFFIIFINWFIMVMGYHFKQFKTFIEGEPIILIENGVIQKKNLKRLFIAEDELMSMMRLKTNIMNIEKIEKAYFENNGQISFILKKQNNIGMNV